MGREGLDPAIKGRCLQGLRAAPEREATPCRPALVPGLGGEGCPTPCPHEGAGSLDPRAEVGLRPPPPTSTAQEMGRGGQGAHTGPGAHLGERTKVHFGGAVFKAARSRPIQGLGWGSAGPWPVGPPFSRFSWRAPSTTMLDSPRTCWPQCSAHQEARPGPRPLAHVVFFIDRATDREDPEQDSVSGKVQLSSETRQCLHPGGLVSGRWNLWLDNTEPGSPEPAHSGKESVASRLDPDPALAPGKGSSSFSVP